MGWIYCSLTWVLLTVALVACGNNQQAQESAKEKKASHEAPMVREAIPAADQGDQPPPPVQEAEPPADQPLPVEQQTAPAAAAHKR